MRRRSFLAAAVLAAAAPAHAANAAAAVTIDNFTFLPAVLTVAAGTKVVWTNHDDIPHSVVDAVQQPPAWKSHALDTDEEFSHVFDTPGRYEYFCSLHPHMKGTVVVQ